MLGVKGSPPYTALSITTAPRYDGRTPDKANQDEVRVHVVAFVEQKIVNTNICDWASGHI